MWIRAGAGSPGKDCKTPGRLKNTGASFSNEPWDFAIGNRAEETYAENGKSSIKLSEYCEPRIEPEIVVCFTSTPPPNASEDQIVNCIDWLAPGFEIVDSVFPDWKFFSAVFCLAEDRM